MGFFTVTRLWRGLAAALAALALVLSFAPAPAQAQTRLPPQGFADLAERLMPAVVNIATTQRLDGIGQAPRGPGWELFGPEGLGEVSSLGSGFVVDPSGVIVTNYHVIEGADQIEVIFQNGDRLRARIVGRDPATDIAVLQVNAGQPLPSVRFGDASRARVGDIVIAIGNPFGLGGSVSAGIISARNRNIDAGRYDDFIQTDAAINRGNSGGPLFNMAGEVIGVNTAIVSPTGASVGVGFAVPSDLVRSVVDQIRRYGETRRGWLGVRIGLVTTDIARRAGLERPTGALITAITPGSPAARAGLQVNDIVTAFDDREIVEARNLTRYVADAQIGATVTLSVLRGQRRLTIRATIARLAEEPREARASRADPDSVAPPPDRVLEGRILGMMVAEITPQLRARYGLRAQTRGLVVLSIDSTSDAAGKLQVGDVIRELQFERLDTVAQAQRLVDRIAENDGRAVLVMVEREGQTTFRSVRMRR